VKIAVIVNPYAGGGKGKRMLPAVETGLKDSGIRYELFVSRHPGHIDHIVRSLSVSEYDGIAAMGGDGTNYQVLNALLSSHRDTRLPALGIIPAGRGNSFARDLPLFSLEEAVAAFCRKTTRAVDVCRFIQSRQHYYFINLLGLGFVTDVAQIAGRIRWAGDFSYVIGILYRTLGLAFHELHIEIDGSIISGKNCFVEICNSKYTGGDMLMAPEAKIDDGLFDAVILSPLRRMALITAFPKLLKGTHGDLSAVRFVRGHSAVISTQPQKVLLPDGELFGATPTIIDVLPRRVRYFY
jgi:diacylglycerol kinase (ATP)